MRVACYLLVLPLVCCFQAAAGDGKDDLKTLEGEWAVLLVENDSSGKWVPLAPASISVKGNHLVQKWGDHLIKGTFTIDPKQKPKTIDITWLAIGDGPKVTSLGLYEIAGDRLRICYPKDDGKRPDSLEPVRESGQQCLVYKRKGSDAEPQPAAKDLPKELKELQGRWDVVGGENGGEKSPFPKELAALVKPQMIIKGHLLIAGLFSEIFEAELGAFMINAKKEPREIDLVSFDDQTKKTTTKLGIYRIEGETLKICFGGEGEERPTAFATKVGTQQDLMILKRAK